MRRCRFLSQLGDSVSRVLQETQLTPSSPQKVLDQLYVIRRDLRVLFERLPHYVFSFLSLRGAGL